MVAYDKATFPNSIGKSWTMTHWQKTKSKWYTVMKYRKVDDNHLAPCWGVRVGSNGNYGRLMALGMKGDLKVPNWKRDYDGQAQFKHVAFVFDHPNMESRFYLDGVLAQKRKWDGFNPKTDEANIATASWYDGWQDDLDCATEAETFFSFNGRKPGFSGMGDEVQQMRLYNGTALTDDEVAQLNAKSTDPVTGKLLQECRRDLQDSPTWVDESGNACAWYAAKRQSGFGNVCQGAVMDSCPIACQSEVPCYGSARPPLPEPAGKVWDRVMLIKPSDREVKHTLCLARTTSKEDIIKKCKSQIGQPNRYPEMKGYRGGNMDDEPPPGAVNVTDCEELERAIDPTCSFDVQNDWTGEWNEMDKDTIGFTISFWIKLPEKKQPEIQFLSGVALPESPVVFTGGRVQACPLDQSRTCENVMNTHEFEENEWTFMSYWYGPDEKGNLAHTIMVNSRAWKENTNAPLWGIANSGLFLEAISIGQETLISPIEFRVGTPTAGQAQKMYYENVQKIAQRRGPLVSDHVSLYSTVGYSQKKFSNVGFLVAPPLLLQSKSKKTKMCESPFGAQVAEDVWMRAKAIRCAPPNECSDEMISSQLSYLPCTGEEGEESLFGRTGVVLNEERVFSEFLMTIAESPILVRGGTQFQTETFFDQQTRQISVVMVFFSQDYGIASLVTVDVSAGTKISAEDSVSHLQVLTDTRLQDFNVYAILCLVFSTFVGIDGLLNLKRGNVSLAVQEIFTFLLISAYLIWSLLFVNGLNEVVEGIVVDTTTVPWTSTTESLKSKTEALLSAVEKIQSTVATQSSLLTLGFVGSMVSILSILYATSAHPRMAVLVNTLLKGADDLFHFFLLVLIIFIFFALAGMAQFGSSKAEFADFSSTLVFLLNCMLGAIPEYFGTEGELRSTLYVFFFLMVAFFLCLNFLLGIIVDAFSAVKQDNVDLECESNFVSDLGASLQVYLTGIRHGWPSHGKILETLEGQSAKFFVDIESLSLAGSWNVKKRLQFLRYFSQYDFLDSASLNPTPNDGDVAELEKRIAILLNVQPTTYAERLMGKRLGWKAKAKPGKRKPSARSLSTGEVGISLPITEKQKQDESQEIQSNRRFENSL
eukprot:gnl/MRDRNA2_/MRDRNA2_14293_c0_seq1.p1 gnl/MRDRNA2_/MRDRNA2_14293_c0~~gnl/MRDRNA2_/MRDRNA2_14293_c0_seq1.p1  ORF type:complete len:1101 (-),score=208.54 gnl/MRDRNA2_/MRDRNA2_14293_c0_seq1:43-3345(-)